MVGKGGDIPKDSEPRDWAEGVNKVRESCGQPRCAGLDLNACLALHPPALEQFLVQGAQACGAGIAAGTAQAPPGVSAAQHPVFPSPSLAAVVRASPSFREEGWRGAGRATLPRFGF